MRELSRQLSIFDIAPEPAWVPAEPPTVYNEDPTDPLYIPPEFRARARVLSMNAAQIWRAAPAPSRTTTSEEDRKAQKRAASALANQHADNVQAAITEGALDLPAIRAALPAMTESDIRAGIRRLRARKFWAQQKED